ncbi:MAG: hypothetical protein A3H28_03040 [Acidobacteria bacterium RIFCSPLOWO2_02_FULL_61_28]|nr:MAG: hypothetical protein A3H28_03040 [Acidobacteria bacterium RIFCSPLOWO2_02_FULL_61_28]
MGMDVFGRAPTTEAGEYFRNSGTWWYPLAEYCCEVALGSSCEHVLLGMRGHVRRVSSKVVIPQTMLLPRGTPTAKNRTSSGIRSARCLGMLKVANTPSKEQHHG